MLIIAALWCLSLLIVNPFGNFPLNDDWSFGLAVKHLLEKGEFRPLGWTSIPLLTNVLWGSLFCLPAGFSFTALRLSTLTLSLLGLLGCYLLIRDLRQPRWLAVVTTLTLGFNPIYYALSNTFMTDVPSTAIMIFAAIFFARSLRTGSHWGLLTGTALAVAATLSRQLAISVPLAFAVSLILTRGFTNRNILRAAIPPAVCLGVLLVFQQWLAASGRLPARYGDEKGYFLYELGHPQTLVSFVVNNTLVGLLYLGLFLLAIVIFAAADILSTHRKQAIAVFAFAIGAILLGGAVRHLSGRGCMMPMSENILIKEGIGPLTLSDTWSLGLDPVPALPKGFWLAITALSLLGAAVLVATLGVQAIHLVPRPGFGGQASDKEAVGIFLLLGAMIYLVPLLPIFCFDRYFVAIIPLASAGIPALSRHVQPRLLANARILRLAALAFLAASSVFAIGGTRDYLAWNRVRWQALHDLMQKDHVSVEDIDGGLEFNGLYLYDPHYHEIPGKSPYWVHGDTYRIGFQNIPGYHVIREYRYLHWLPPYIGKVVVLQQNSPPPHR
jgi:hypothetical protein